MIDATCPKCLRSYQIRDDVAKRTLKCSCGNRFRVSQSIPDWMYGDSPQVIANEVYIDSPCQMPVPIQQNVPNPVFQTFQVREDSWQQAPRHYKQTDGTTALVLGLVSLLIMPILGPVAIAAANSVLRENPNDSSANAGWACGAIATIILVIGVICGILLFIGTMLMAEKIEIEHRRHQRNIEQIQRNLDD